MDTKTYPVTRSNAEWRKLLTPEQYHIMREHGTERPGWCALHEKRARHLLLRRLRPPPVQGKVKFESGTGWPSFNEPSRAGSRRPPTAATA